MSYGLTFINNSNQVVIDSEFARLNVICNGRYAPTQESGLGSTTFFPRVITSAEPPLVFCRPDTGGIAGLTAMQVIGSAGNWTGFYVRAYDINTAQPNGRYFAATFGAQPVATYGMRLWDGSSKLLFDSGTPTALFTRAFQNWVYVRSETTPNLKARIDRSCRSLLATNRVAVVNIDPSGRLQVAQEHRSRESWPGRVRYPPPLDDLPQRSLY